MSADSNLPDPDQTAKDSGPAPISSTTPGAGEELLQAGIMQQPDQPGMLGKIGRFDVIQVIGQGGMGQVLLAREPATNVKVAIKVLKPQIARDDASVHRFMTEARHAYAMGHPNILKVLEVSDTDDRPFYVMPYIEGGSLARRIGPRKPLPTDTALDVARQIAGALSYAHGRGIIHRDLKPANVLLDREGRAYLTDFGLLRTVFNDSFVDVQQSSLEGTAPYMSPAVVAGKAEDTRCDIYSFGAMLYEMLTGQPPYLGPSIEIILKKITAGPPEPILKINPKAAKPLAAIADWAMARELRDRYATMADVLADLDRVAKGQEPVGPRGTVGLGRRTRRNLAIAGAAVAVATMLAFGLWNTASKKPPITGESLSFDGVDGGMDVGVSPFPHVTNTFTIELWANPVASRAETAEATGGNITSDNHRFAVYPDQGGVSYGGGHAAAGLSIGTNGVTVFEHADGYMPSRLVYSTAITGWTHVALVYSNRSPMLYVNGVFARGVSASVYDYVHPSVNLGRATQIFHRQCNFDGQLDEVRIWKVARTAAELQSNMKRHLAGTEPGLCGYWRLDEGTGSVASDASGNGLVGRLMGGVAWTKASRRVSSTSRGLGDAGQKIDLTSGLVAHFPLDGHVRDVTGNGHDGQIHGNVKFVNGPIGQAIDLDGSSWVTLPDRKFLDGISNVTVALWFFNRAASEWRTAFCSAEGGMAPTICVQFDCGISGFKNCGFGDAVGAANIKQSAEASRNVFQNHKWHFFTMTLEGGVDATSLRIYVDGYLKETTTISRAVPIRYDRPMVSGIGAVAGSLYWLGSLDDVRIYNRTLSPAEIQKLYASASPPMSPAAPAVVPPPPPSPVPGQPAVPGVPRPGLMPIPAIPGTAAPGVRPVRLPERPARPAATTSVPTPSSVVPAGQARNLITNGGFEMGRFAPNWQDRQVLMPGSTLLVGWAIAENHVLRGMDNTRRAPGDTNSYFHLFLKGYSAEPPYGAVSQTIATEAGRAYRLSFDLGIWSAPEDRLPETLCSVVVKVGSTNASFTNRASIREATSWQTCSIAFVAEGSQTPITIQGQSSPRDIQLDNVLVEPWSGPANLLANADFELEGEPGKPAQWSTFDWSNGKTDIKFEWSNEAHSGRRSLAISSKEGGDGAWIQRIEVEPYRNYRFSGWVKTQNIQSKGGNGVLFDFGAHNPGHVALRLGRDILRGSNDWQRFETVFNSQNFQNLTMVCTYGFRGALSGKAWFDDVSLVKAKEMPHAEGSIFNGSFEEADGDWPLGWSVRGWSDWAPKFEYAKIGHTGSRSVKIWAQPWRSGLWAFMAKVKPNISYKLSGWIRTENLTGGGRANLAVGTGWYWDTGKDQPFATETLANTKDWTPVSVTFRVGTNDFLAVTNNWIQIACQLSGGGDTAAGSAWFDDIALEEVPAPPAPAPQPLRVPTRPGVAPAVPAPAAPPRADWRSLLQQADAAYAENRYAEAIKLYDTALAGLEQDQTTDATILKTMKAAAQKHRSLATFIPQRDKLPADQQVEALHAKLRELNPKYDGKGRFTIRDGKIVEAWLFRAETPDLSPLKGLPLTRFNCQATGVRDISPLRGMPLQELDCSWNQVADLSPLKGMRLTSLELEHESGGVTDLSPLKGMPLKRLHATGNRIKDLSPLQGMPLEFLTFAVRGGMVEDLSPLRGMPLQVLNFIGNRVSDLSPLRQCPLKDLRTAGNPIRDLSALKGLALTLFACPDDATDLSPLAGMPIVSLALDSPKVTDLTVVKDLPLLQNLYFKAANIKTGWEAIRQHPTLKSIEPTAGAWEAARPAAEFWKRFDAGEFTNAPPK